MPTLRVLSYNVRSLRDDKAAVSRVIAAAAPDVVCVQEAPRFLRWRTRASELARRCGLVVVGGGRPAAGNLLLCQIGVEVERCGEIALTRRGRHHPRAAAVAICSLAGRRFVLVGTHLDTDRAGAGERLRHLHELFERLHETVGDDSLPVVLGADVNEDPSGQTFAALANRLRDCYAEAGTGAGETFPARSPRRRIDGIFADRRLPVLRAGVPDGPGVDTASDHRPVFAELDLP